MHLAAALLSCGLDPMESVTPSETKKTILFLQSCVPDHCVLSWLLASTCSVNRLAHLPQWREKSAAAAAVPSHATSEPSTATAAGFSNTGNPTASVGLFTYPILQAADILLYDADAVPVGVDQIGHLELTRDLARSVAARWPDLAQHVRVPRILLNEVPKVLNLRDPSKKMSKSQGPEAGTIWLTDTPDIIRHKVGRAQTDSLRGVSYDPVARPGIANLIQLYSALKDLSIQSATEELSRLSKVDLKLKITDELVRELSPIQERFNELTSSLTANPDSYLYTVLSVGSSVAQHMASKKLRIFFEALGLPRHFLTQQAVKR
uniref:tryptophan--tRNA ligase n=2 Tax=Schistocephalus solidus TaxID=70667 RepID=A0A0X3Q9V6_SCHSO